MIASQYGSFLALSVSMTRTGSISDGHGKAAPIDAGQPVHCDGVSGSVEFYERLNQVLSADGFDDFVEDLCEPFYVQGKGRPRIPPGTYFRMLLVGF